MPDLTILLDIPVEDAIARKEGDTNRLEEVEFLKRVRDAYISLSTRHTERIKVVDARMDRHLVHEQIVRYVESILQKKTGELSHDA